MQLLKKQIFDMAGQAFSEAMGREGETLEGYWTGATYPVLFRKNSDVNQQTNRLSIFYSANLPIGAGTLLRGHGRVYLSNNQETPENSDYRRSDIWETNLTINTVSGDHEIMLPAFAEVLQSPYPSTGGMVSIIGGTIEVVTGDCQVSRSLSINSEFSALGGVYKVVNRYFANGMAYFFVERQLDRPEEIPSYTLTIDIPGTFALGTSILLSATAIRDEQVITNATLQWSSSDPAIASIDNGTVSFLTAGEAVITALWLEHGISASKSITVSEEDSIDCTISGSDTIVHGMNSTYSASIYINGQPSTEGFVLSWSLDRPADLVGKVSLTSNGLSTTVAVVDDENLVSKTFNLVASVEHNGDISNFTKLITIRGWF